MTYGNEDVGHGEGLSTCILLRFNVVNKRGRMVILCITEKEEGVKLFSKVCDHKWLIVAHVFT